MIHFVVAYDAEARPLIDYFRLKRLHHEQSFPCYLGDQHALIVSGMGKLAAAAATAHLHGITGFVRHRTWVNIGIAGHPDLAIGETRLAHQIIDETHREVYFPQPCVKHELQTETLYSLDEADSSYRHQGLIDMEASAFFATANRYASAELVHAIKIVSDNRSHPLNGIPQKKQIIDLIATQVEVIDSFSSALHKLSATLQPDPRIVIACDHYQAHFHFSLSQVERLKHLLQKWIAIEPLVTSDIMSKLEAHNSKFLLQHLEEQISQEY